MYSPFWALEETQYNLGIVTSRDCCGNIYVTDDDEREIRFWEIIYDDINSKFDKVVSNELFGNKNMCDAQNVMDAHHLLLFLQLIQRERELDEYNSETGVDKGNAYYIDKYCTIRVREQFLCKGYSIQAILEVFRLFELDDPTGGGTVTPTSPDGDGIGYMGIEQATDPVFRIS